MRGDEHLLAAIFWVYREVYVKLGRPCTVEVEEWARREVQRELSPLLEVLRQHDTNRMLADVLLRHGETINRITPRVVAFNLTMEIIMEELGEMSKESFDQLPQEAQQDILEIIHRLITKRARTFEINPN